MIFKKILINLLLLLGTFLFCLLVLEVGLRLLFPQPMTKDKADPELGWVHAPKAQFTYTRQEFSTNVSYSSFGLRDSEHSLQKAPGVFRIAVLGDSYIEGLQVPLDSVFSKVLERTL